MERFYGFDLGDAESAVCVLSEKAQQKPEVLPVSGAGSFITAYARQTDGALLIGEEACYAADVVFRRLRFKSRFLTDQKTEEDVRQFAAGVLAAISEEGQLDPPGEDSFYVGCPAGWDGQARERYRSLFERAGYPPVRIVSESRAAMVCACQSRHLQVGYDILSRALLVVDVGSSTTDFAYIHAGHEVEMRTAGEVALGGGLLDEAILDTAVSSSLRSRELRRVFEESEAWRHYCEFAARRLKEAYFSDEDYYAAHPCKKTLQIRYRLPLRLTLSLDAKSARSLLEGPLLSLDGRSFSEVFLESLQAVASQIDGPQPELLFLTGGLSKMEAVRRWCQEVFPEAVIIAGAEPEYAVARGLAFCGRIDEDMRQFRKELAELTDSRIVEDIVSSRIGSLYRSLVEAITDPLLSEVALPVFRMWRSGEIETLKETDRFLEEGILDYLHSEDARSRMSEPVSAWLRPVGDDLEHDTVPICIRHHVPYHALSLTSGFSAEDLKLRIDARDVFAVEEITLLIDSVISLLVGALCGGGGMALVSAGPGGAMAGVLASVVVLLLGKNKMEEAILSAKLPKPVRKLIPESAFRSRMETVSADVKARLYATLEQERGGEITDRLVEDISNQIEACLTRMAEVVEIPLSS